MVKNEQSLHINMYKQIILHCFINDIFTKKSLKKLDRKAQTDKVKRELCELVWTIPATVEPRGALGLLGLQVRIKKQYP